MIDFTSYYESCQAYCESFFDFYIDFLSYCDSIYMKGGEIRNE